MKETKKGAEASSIRVDRSLYDRMRIHAIKAKVGIRQAANEALKAYLEKRGA